MKLKQPPIGSLVGVHDLFEMTPTLFRKLPDYADKFFISAPKNFVPHGRSNLFTVLNFIFG